MSTSIFFVAFSFVYESFAIYDKQSFVSHNAFGGSLFIKYLNPVKQYTMLIVPKTDFGIAICACIFGLCHYLTG